MQLVKPQKLSDIIMQKLEDMILSGDLVPGQKLPSERELAVRFEVSRPSLREAIQKLEIRGLLERKQGGGTYVQQQITPLGNNPLLDLISSKPESQFDLLEFRHMLEGMAAYYAALRASEQDLEKIDIAFNAERKAALQGPEAQAEALCQFYLRLAEAAHNSVLFHVMNSLRASLQDNIERNLKMLSVREDYQQRIATQREGILLAVKQRDPDGAREASNKHLAFIEQTLLDINQQDSRIQRALRRIDV